MSDSPTPMTMKEYDYRAHLSDTVSDSGMIEGTCSTCGKVLYSTTTATMCHRAGSWMRNPNPHAYSWLDHPMEDDI